MNMPVLKTEPQTIARAPSATVVALNAPTPGFLRSRILPAARTVAVSTLPPLVTLCILLGRLADAVHEAGRDAAVADQDLE